MNNLLLPFMFIASMNADTSLLNDTYFGIDAIYGNQKISSVSSTTTDSNLYFNTPSHKGGFGANIGKRLQLMEGVSIGLETEYFTFKSFGAKPNAKKSQAASVQHSLNFRCVNTNTLTFNVKPRYHIANSNFVISPMLGAMHWKSKVELFHNSDDNTESRLTNTSWGFSYGLELEYQATSDVNLKMGVRQFKTDIPYGEDNIVNTDITSIYAGFDYTF